jgi:hypothetical protein
MQEPSKVPNDKETSQQKQKGPSELDPGHGGRDVVRAAEPLAEEG